MAVIDTTQLWDALGSSWENFQNKDVVEAFWQGLSSGLSVVNTYTLETQKSRTLEYMSPTIDSGPENYFLVYSGLSTDLTVDLLASGGLFSYQIDDWTYSIPTITSEYKYRGVTYSGLYTEGIDYTISGMNHIVWNTTPPTQDLRFSDKGVLVGYARHVYRLNPVLMGVWAREIGATYDDLSSYETYGNDQYTHLKMLIWALVTERMRGPSIKMLKDSFGIAHGMPFAYESGLMSYTSSGGHYNVYVGDDTYVFPSGLVPIASGYVDKFDLLASGLALWDYVTNAGLVNAHANVYNRRNTLIYQMSSTLSGLSYSDDFFDAFLAEIMPVQLQYLTI
jgi:hypothetical protein